MNTLSIILILITIFGMLSIIYVSNYNKLQYLKTKIEQAESIIDDSLRNKYDTIVKLNIIIKKVIKDKKEYLKEYVNLKNHKISNFDLDRKLVEAMNVIYELQNDFSNLEKNEEFKKLLQEIKTTDEKLSAVKGYYNKNTSLSNELSRKFPSNFVSKIHNIKIKPFFDGKDMTDDILDDFRL